jgi:hypothetical protein
VSTIKLTLNYSKEPIFHEAPVVRGVQVWTHTASKHQKKPRRKTTALVNTGADVTQVPSSIIDDVGEDTGRVVALSAPGVKLRLANLHRVRFRICSHDVETEWAVPVDSDYIDLGRDILSRYTVSVCWPVAKAGKLEMPKNGTAIP